MSSSLNFHDAVSITMEANEYGSHACAISIKARGDLHWHNNHQTTFFMPSENFPYFKYAVDAFNEALTEFYEIKAAAEQIDESEPFP